MTIQEFNKLKLNDPIYQYNTNDWKIEEYKIKLINYKDKVFQINDNIYAFKDNDCFYIDKNKCLIEHLKHMFEYHNICISDIELSIKNLNKEKEQYLKDIQNLKIEYADLIEKNIEEFI